MTDSVPDLQDAIYHAAQADERGMVAALLKEIFAASDVSRDDLGGYYATIDAVTPKMAHLSLVVLSVQAGATGLFRHLAEQKPDEARRIAESIAPVLGRTEFVRPLAELGADPKFMSGALLARAAHDGNLNLVTYMIEQGADPDSTAHMTAPRHALAAAGAIGDTGLRRAMMEVLLSGGATWNALPEEVRKTAQESYVETRQSDIAQQALRNLKLGAAKRSLKPPSP